MKYDFQQNRTDKDCVVVLRCCSFSLGTCHPGGNEIKLPRFIYQRDFCAIQMLPRKTLGVFVFVLF